MRHLSRPYMIEGIFAYKQMQQKIEVMSATHPPV